MKTAMIDGIRKNISFKCNTRLYLRHSHPALTRSARKSGQYGGDIYTVDDDDSVKVLVGTATNGADLDRTITVISQEDYSEIVELDDPYNNIPFHNAIMSKMGFS